MKQISPFRLRCDVWFTATFYYQSSMTIITPSLPRDIS